MIVAVVDGSFWEVILTAENNQQATLSKPLEAHPECKHHVFMIRLLSLRMEIVTRCPFLRHRARSGGYRGFGVELWVFRRLVRQSGWTSVLLDLNTLGVSLLTGTTLSFHNSHSDAGLNWEDQ